MSVTHFQTFIDAFALIEKQDRLLAGDFVICPPSNDFGYQSTPKNALTFATMGVDGVHYAVLTINGIVRDDSPVVQVSPMDSEDVFILAGSFLNYLADGCDVSTRKMQAVFKEERAGKHTLIAFLNEHFDRCGAESLLDDARIDRLMAQYGHLIQRKNQ